MDETDALFNMLFGWGFVIIAVLLFFILIVALRSTFSFKNATVVKGKIIELTDIGELSLPTVECYSEGQAVRFKTKTPINNLIIGQDVDVEISSSNEPRIYDEDRVDHAPKILFMIIILLSFFCVKSFSFLNTFFS
jgi:hypothetical protein